MRAFSAARPPSLPTARMAVGHDARVGVEKQGLEFGNPLRIRDFRQDDERVAHHEPLLATSGTPGERRLGDLPARFQRLQETRSPAPVRFGSESLSTR